MAKKGKAISHNKIKNSGLLFEMLVRQFIVDNMSNKSSIIPEMLKKYFGPTSEMGKEFQLYKLIVDSKKLTEGKAIHLIDIVVSRRRKLDEQKLQKEKYNLIKEIKETYPLEEFLSANISNYKLYASVYKLFAVDSESETVNNLNEIIDSRFCLIEHLTNDTNTSSKNEVLDHILQQDEEVRTLTYRFAVNNFNTKYEHLMPEQRNLLREYVLKTKRPKSFVEYVHLEANKLKKQMVEKINTLKDKVLKIKLGEVVSRLDVISERKKIKNKDVIALMLGYELNKELREGL